MKEVDQPAKIYLNLLEGATRQNFTCAHELGHVVERRNNGDDEYSFRDTRGQTWDDNDSREWYAEHFASNLLMPLSDFDVLVDRGLSTPQLARQFGVSHAAVRTRARILRINLND